MYTVHVNTLLYFSTDYHLFSAALYISAICCECPPISGMQTADYKEPVSNQNHSMLTYHYLSKYLALFNIDHSKKRRSCENVVSTMPHKSTGRRARSISQTVHRVRICEKFAIWPCWSSSKGPSRTGQTEQPIAHLKTILHSLTRQYSRAMLSFSSKTHAHKAFTFLVG